MTDETAIEPAPDMPAPQPAPADAAPAPPEAAIEPHGAASRHPPTGLQSLLEGVKPAPPADELTVPLARLKGVQRQLSTAEKERESYRAQTAELQARLDASEKRAAAEYVERLRATRTDIVPQLIGGETVEQVEQSLAGSLAAFSAAQQAYARQLPTPPPAVGSGAPQAADPPLSPLQLLRAGLSQPRQDINH